MRISTATLACLVLASCGHASEPQGLKTATAEVDSNKDGRPDARTEIITRGGVKQMMIFSRADKDGDWRVAARSFYAGTNLTATESDEDGDGFFEMLVVFPEKSDEVNAFIRGQDGSVRPADIETVAILRKQDTLLSEFWGNPDNYNAEKSESAMEELREKFKEIGKPQQGTK